MKREPLPPRDDDVRPARRRDTTRFGGEPAVLSREGRIYLLSTLAADLLAGRMPSQEAALFLASAIQAWLTNGDDIENYLRVRAPRGSHRTVRRIREELLNGGLIGDDDTTPPNSAKIPATSISGE